MENKVENCITFEVCTEQNLKTGNIFSVKLSYASQKTLREKNSLDNVT